MKDKEKEKLTKKEQEATNENEKKELDEKKQEPNLDPEVLERIVAELEEKYNLKKENIKIVKIKKEPPKRSLRKLLIRDLLFWIFDFLLIISLHGYLKFSEPDEPVMFILRLFLFSLVFYIIELLIRFVLTKRYQRLVIYSFGTIMVPVTIIALVLAHVMVGLQFSDNDKMIGFFILFIVVRIALRYVLMRKELKAMMRGRKR